MLSLAREQAFIFFFFFFVVHAKTPNPIDILDKSPDASGR